MDSAIQSSSDGQELNLPIDGNQQNDQEQKESFIQNPSIELPKGGGAVRGIDEKFSVNQATGSLSFSVPVFVSPSRGGFNPVLSLNYDSSQGRSVFGQGWNLPVQKISRKTDKGIPQYREDNDSDTFIFSQAEDLVPQLKFDNNNWIDDTRKETLDSGLEFEVRKYRPRTEGTFIVIEKWKSIDNGETYWRVVNQDNVVSIFGRSKSHQILNPEDNSQIFEWLLETVYDDKGNLINYEYKSEDTEKLDRAAVSNKNRFDDRSLANKYLKQILYGNKTPFVANNWMFQVVFDYGEHDQENPMPEDDLGWSHRLDSYSSYRSGFEIRTNRLCQRVLMFHNFDELANNPVLVRSTNFEYLETPSMTYLTSVSQSGSNQDGAVIPPVTFEYSKPVVSSVIKNLNDSQLENLPEGLSSSNYRFIDLDGEGISGILAEQSKSWFYKRNLGSGNFEAMKPIANSPQMASVAENQQVLTDINSDGKLELVVRGESGQGYFTRERDQTWSNFRPFESVPNIEWTDPNVRLLDLTGNGLADILMTEHDVFRWSASEGCDGYSESITFAKYDSDESGPTIVFSDGDQTVYLADMTGDGLTDIVRIRNGNICYWPNLGYGKFGPQVTMDNAPNFDTTDQFDQLRLYLSDIDGSGIADLVYVNEDSLSIWYNQSGNGWSALNRIALDSKLSNQTEVTIADLLGKGTPCVVFTNLSTSGAKVQYIDLMAQGKPHLLVSAKNNMGLERNFSFVSSVQFYLEDKRNSKPWITNLPFPVHVLEKAEVNDLIAGTKLTSRYAYHHGYFDGMEREFRGFALVESWDAEEFTDSESDITRPPTYTKSWYHTGAYGGDYKLTLALEKEYFSGDEQAWKLEQVSLPQGLSTEESRQAHRAFRGSLLRQELYSQDNSTKSHLPYNIVQNSYKANLIQGLENQSYAVFYSIQEESITYHYEREFDSIDPRVSQTLNLHVNEFGQIEKSASIVYPRRQPEYDEQAKLYSTYAEMEYHNIVNDNDVYRLGIPKESRNFEISNIPYDGSSRITAKGLLEFLDDAEELSFENAPIQDVLSKRLISRTKTRYYDDSLTEPLNFEQIDSLAIPYDQRVQVFTPELLNSVYGSKLVDQDLLDSGYIFDEDVWWNQSGHQEFDKDNFYIPTASIDPFGARTVFEYDSYNLLLERTVDALGNTIFAKYDYRYLTPYEVTDLNLNRQRVMFNELGLPVATVIMGKENEQDPDEVGDTLDDPTSRIEYNFFNWLENEKPAYVKNTIKVFHGSSDETVESYIYTDGSGREFVTKTIAEPGDVPQRDPSTGMALTQNGNLLFEHSETRWRVSGRTVYDNKGSVVRQYEPYFSDTFDFEPENALVEWGVSIVNHYDPLGRLIRVDTPKGFFTKVEFSPWMVATYDQNDTVLESRYYAELDPENASEPDDRHEALLKAKEHANTPMVSILDTLGRTFLTKTLKERNGEPLCNYSVFDIQGNPTKGADARFYKQNLAGDDTSAVYNFEYIYDMASSLLRTVSIDAGQKLTFYDTLGRPKFSWTGRGYRTENFYDELSRPIKVIVSGNGLDNITELFEYGDNTQESIALNQNGQLVKHYDQAGMVENERFDFKGNLISSKRKIRSEFKNEAHWDSVDDSRFLNGEHTSKYKYDALNRIIEHVRPDGTVSKPKYHKNSLLASLTVKLKGDELFTSFVDLITYNAKGQRERILYGNGVETKYTYEPTTFRLVQLTSFRRNPHKHFQRNFYTYDPVSNVTQIVDASVMDVFSYNQEIDVRQTFTYDAMYQLLTASGREHNSNSNEDYRKRSEVFKNTSYTHINDRNKLVNYNRSYEYDDASNLNRIVHNGASNFTRTIEVSENSNRALLSSELNQTTNFENLFDAEGNLLKLEHLSEIKWNYRNNVSAVTIIERLGESDKEYFVYDSSGSRIRKVTEYFDSQGNLLRQVDKLYLDSVEIEQTKLGNNLDVVSERYTIHVMDDVERIALVNHWTQSNSSNITINTNVIRYQLSNQLNSTSFELSDTGELISYEEYFPFGGTAFTAGTSEAEVNLKLYRYSGKERDDTTGLYYYGARYYIPWLGRWLNPDPAGPVDGSNLYFFVLNNPINMLDATGNGAWPVTRNWNEKDLEKFGEFVDRGIERIMDKADNETNLNKEGKLSKFSDDVCFDCADLFVYLLVEYAYQEGLELEFTTHAGTKLNSSSKKTKFFNTRDVIEFDPSDPRKSVDQFSITARASTRAGTLRSDSTEVKLDERKYGGDVEIAGWTHVRIFKREVTDEKGKVKWELVSGTSNVNEKNACPDKLEDKGTPIRRGERITHSSSRADEVFRFNAFIPELNSTRKYDFSTRKALYIPEFEVNGQKLGDVKVILNPHEANNMYEPEIKSILFPKTEINGQVSINPEFLNGSVPQHIIDLFQNFK